MKPDVALCSFNSCPKKNDCHRGSIKPNELHTFINFKYICNEENNYEWLIPLHKNETIEKEDDSSGTEENKTT
jgi:hypothetical protein